MDHYIVHSKYIGVSENKAELNWIIKSKQIGTCNIYLYYL